MRKYIGVLIFVASGFVLCSFHKTPSCDTIKNGRFHFYPTGSNGKHYIIDRKDSIQSEIDFKTYEMSVWNVNWLSDCVFYLNYKSGLSFKNDMERKAYENALIKVSITKVTDQYFTYKSLLTMGSYKQEFNDTMWFKEK